MKLTLVFEDDEFTFYIVTKKDHLYRSLEYFLPRVMKKYEPTDEETEIEGETKENASILLWDYDNVRLKKELEFHEDFIAQSLAEIVGENKPFTKSICVTAESLYPLERKKIKLIDNDFDIYLEDVGKDSTDMKLDMFAREFLKDNSNSKIILISGDHHYIPTITDSIDKGATLILIHNGNASKEYMNKLSEFDVINLAILKKKQNQCIKCLKSFQSMEALSKHYEEEHKIYVCKYCQDENKSLDELKEHVRKNHVQCNFCDEVLANKKERNKHYIDKHHEKLPEVTCYDCTPNVIFGKKHDRDQHRQSKHNK